MPKEHKSIAIERLNAASCAGLASAFGGGDIGARLGRHLQQQADGARVVLVALHGGQAVGYGCLVWRSPYPPFAATRIPEIQDLNVVAEVRRRGVGSALLDELEDLALARCDTVGIGVGLYADYGPAQRLYVRRGYVPDGCGVRYGDRTPAPGEAVRLDDDLVLYLTKRAGRGT
ncbi:MAG: GNAT family N-acetyltransferase [Myxococcales bacterium]|nr:GNAT family N-acetyltransferase [Myxococcales bacterium]